MAENQLHSIELNDMKEVTSGVPADRKLEKHRWSVPFCKIDPKRTSGAIFWRLVDKTPQGGGVHAVRSLGPRDRSSLPPPSHQKKTRIKNHKRNAIQRNSVKFHSIRFFKLNYIQLIEMKMNYVKWDLNNIQLH